MYTYIYIYLCILIINISSILYVFNCNRQDDNILLINIQYIQYYICSSITIIQY